MIIKSGPCLQCTMDYYYKLIITGIYFENMGVESKKQIGAQYKQSQTWSVRSRRNSGPVTRPAKFLRAANRKL